MVLLREAGFACIGVHPLNQQMSKFDPDGKGPRKAELLPYCSSILLVAQLMRKGS